MSSDIYVYMGNIFIEKLKKIEYLSHFFFMIVGISCYICILLYQRKINFIITYFEKKLFDCLKSWLFVSLNQIKTLFKLLFQQINRPCNHSLCKYSSPQFWQKLMIPFLIFNFYLFNRFGIFYSHIKIDSSSLIDVNLFKNLTSL